VGMDTPPVAVMNLESCIVRESATTAQCHEPHRLGEVKCAVILASVTTKVASLQPHGRGPTATGQQKPEHVNVDQRWVYAVDFLLS